MCATILLVASAMAAVEAGVMLILGPARSIVVKPFILLGYLEVCAALFSIVGIVCAIVGFIFYRPYLYLSEQWLLRRARRAGEVSNRYIRFEDDEQAEDAEEGEFRD